MEKIKFLVVAFVLFFISPSVFSAEVNHFVSKADNEVSASDIYNSSVVIAGESVKIDGSVNGIVFGAGNRVDFDGVADYGVIAGNRVNLNGNIANDSLIAGNVVTTTEESVFTRDVIMAGTDVSLSGNFERNISLYAGNVTLQNVNIKGNLKIYGQKVTVLDDVTISGTLFYPEDCNYSASDSAVITAVKKTPALQTEDEENYFATLSSKLWSLLGMVLVFAAISLFFPKAFSKIDEKYEKIEVSEGVEVFTKGLVVLILVPIISMMLFFTMIGIPLAIILLLVYGVSIYLSSAFTGYLIGYKIWQKVFNQEGHAIFFGLIGLTVLFILELIPVLRFFITLIAVPVGLGLIFDTIKSRD